MTFNGVVSLNGVLVKSWILLTLHSDTTLSPWENEAMKMKPYLLFYGMFCNFIDFTNTVVLL